MNSTTTTTEAATTATVPIIPPRQQSVPVLIVAHGDGYLESYSENHVNVQMVTMPFAGMNAEAELAAEAYLERQLSRPFRNVYCPGLRTTLGKPLSARPSDIAKREYDLEVLRGIQQATKDGKR